ncbi:MAG: hypothetical protein M1281_19000, partial [Chloroflexi bacterium]|nr:hypothetical protein [Chloroflexota bacterium]
NPHAATATPAPVALTTPRCYPSTEGGLWCLLTASNRSSEGVENLSVLFRMAAANAASQSEQTASPLLDLLLPQASLPLAAYFPPPVPLDYSVEA